MRPLRDIKRLVAQAPVHSTPARNQAVLDDLLKELAVGPHIQGNGIRVHVVRVAVAAAVISIVALVFIRHTSREPVRQPPYVVTPSVVDMLTVGRLNAACRRGGLPEVERQCEHAAQRLQGRPERISTEQLILEMKGT